MTSLPAESSRGTLDLLFTPEAMTRAQPILARHYMISRNEELDADRGVVAKAGLDRGRLGDRYLDPLVLVRCVKPCRVMGQIHNESTRVVRNLGSVGFWILSRDRRIRL